MAFIDTTIDFATLSHQEIESKLEKFNIALTPEEILKVQNEILGRTPTLTECVLWSIQGSEHCSYKSSRTHLKQFLTEGPRVMLGPGEDAGIVELCRDNEGRKYGIVMSHESHNHPSQIVPYEGAATGVGGNVRDVACMGAKVIGVLDSLRFGEINRNKTKWLVGGVTDGIAGYANPIGVPNLGGDCYFDESYNNNCLVNVVTLGILREDQIIHSRAPQNSEGYDLILVGKPTDNSGFGGASFASIKMEEDKKEQNKGAVQEPNAFLKRHLLKSTYELFKILEKKKLMDKVGFKDLGAGGVACAAVELADNAEMGAEVELDKVHVSMEGLHPSVILCSETQERFMWVAHPDVTKLILNHYNKTFDLPRVSEGARASAVGKIRGDGQFIVTYKGVKVVSAKTSDVMRGLVYDRPYKKQANRYTPETEQTREKGVNEKLLSLLTQPNIASRSPIYEKYDKNVQGITVIERGDADAGVVQPFKSIKITDLRAQITENAYPNEIHNIGIAVSVAQNPSYCKIDPYWGGVNAVVEAALKVASVGAMPIALTDCLNFGNPEKAEQMWEFAEGVRGVADAARKLNVPIISGNVSLYNESNNKPIAPSPIVACLGRVNDVHKALNMHFKEPDSVLLMISRTNNDNLAKPDLDKISNKIKALVEAIETKLILSSHVIKEGGIAVALSEMAFKNEIGFKISIPGGTSLWDDSQSFILEIKPELANITKEIFARYDIQIREIGRTTTVKKLIINDLINLDLALAKEKWTNGLRDQL